MEALSSFETSVLTRATSQKTPYLIVVHRFQQQQPWKFFAERVIARFLYIYGDYLMVSAA
jgi:hypothetical protein